MSFSLFAQFEREVIGERVRDKIAASKRRGIWVGGPVPFGYRVADKKVVVVPEETATVRMLFTRYLELGSIGALIKDLDRRGVRTKTSRLVDGRVRGGIRFGTGALAHLLENRFYIGEVAYRGAIHAGGHQAIIERELFEAVQARLAENAVGRRAKLRSSPAILTGRIVDDRGNRMSPSHSNKLGVRYRYYVSHAILQRRKAEAGSVTRLPAAEIETLVLDGVRIHCASMGQTEEPDRHYRSRPYRAACPQRDRQTSSAGSPPRSSKRHVGSNREAQTQRSYHRPATHDGHHNHAALDGAKLRCREGHRSCALHKTGTNPRAVMLC